MDQNRNAPNRYYDENPIRSTTRTATIKKKSFHVKWEGVTVSLGTLPIDVGNVHCAIAKKLTETWRLERPRPTVDWVKRELELAGLRIVNDRPGRRRVDDRDVLVRQQVRLFVSMLQEQQPDPHGSSSTIRSSSADTASFSSSSLTTSRRGSANYTNQQPLLIPNNLVLTAVDSRGGAPNMGSVDFAHFSPLSSRASSISANSSNPLFASSNLMFDYRGSLADNNSTLNSLLLLQSMSSSVHPPHPMRSNEANLSYIARMESNGLPYSSMLMTPNQQATTIPFQTTTVHNAGVGLPFSPLTRMVQNQQAFADRYQQIARANLPSNQDHTTQNWNSSIICPPRTFSVDQAFADRYSQNARTNLSSNHNHTSQNFNSSSICPSRTFQVPVDQNSQSSTPPVAVVDPANNALPFIRRTSNLTQRDKRLSGGYCDTITTLTTTTYSEPVQVLSDMILEEETRRTNTSSPLNDDDDRNFVADSLLELNKGLSLH